jgi:hypothetical protein
MIPQPRPGGLAWLQNLALPFRPMTEVGIGVIGPIRRAPPSALRDTPSTNDPSEGVAPRVMCDQARRVQATNADRAFSLPSLMARSSHKFRMKR